MKRVVVQSIICEEVKALLPGRYLVVPSLFSWASSLLSAAGTLFLLYAEGSRSSTEQKESTK